MAQRSPKGGGRAFYIGMALAGGVLLLVLILAALVLFVPSLRQRAGLETPAPTATAVPSPSAQPTQVAATATATLVPATPSPTPTPIPADQYADLLLQAQALTLRSQFDEAIELYDSLAQNAPKDARAQIGLAWAWLYDAQAEQAVAHGRRALALDSGSAEAATVLSRAYAELGDTTQALARAEEAEQLDPESAEAHAALSDAYRAAGRAEQAALQAELALEKDAQNANAHRARAWAHRLTGDLGRAANELQAAAGLQPELWLRWHELGQLLLEAENERPAVAAFQNALDLRPKAVTYSALGEAHFWLGEYERASDAAQAALVLGAEDATTYAVLAVAGAYLGECEEALADAERALALEPGQPLALEAQTVCAGGEKPGLPTASPSPIVTPRPTRAPAALAGRIAFPVWNLERGKYDTYLAQARDGGSRALVAQEMHQPALRPDGQWLALNGERHEHMNLFVVKADGSGLQEITSFVEDGQPAWSPDGKKLALGSNRHGDKEWRIYIIDEVPYAGGKVEGRTLNYGPDDVRGEMPAWTADNRIVFRACDLESPPGQCQGDGLSIMSAAPGPHQPKALTSLPGDAAPAVAGDRIAFMSDRDGNWELYVMNLDGSGLKRLTVDPSADGLPTWSPDGKIIAFVSDQGGSWAVWAINPDGSGRRRLFAIGGVGLASDWQGERISWGR